MPKIINDAGEWVDYANTCRKCGNHMPLPECDKTYCEKCGTYCHFPNMREATEMAEAAKKICPNLLCKHKNDPEANYCIKCGARLEQRDAVWKKET